MKVGYILLRARGFRGYWKKDVWLDSGHPLHHRALARFSRRASSLIGNFVFAAFFTAAA